MSDKQEARPEIEIDPAKRETLQKLGQAAWVVPLVATFAIGGLSMSKSWAQSGNGNHRS